MIMCDYIVTKHILPNTYYSEAESEVVVLDVLHVLHNNEIVSSEMVEEKWRGPTTSTRRAVRHVQCSNR